MKLNLDCIDCNAVDLMAQIDKQAAESLGKNERPRSDDDVSIGTPTKLSDSVPLKDQLKKKTQDSYDYGVRLSTDSNSSKVSNRDGNIETTSTSGSPSHKSAVNDGDWTELLGSSNEIASPSTANRSNGTTVIHAAKSNSRRPGSVSSNYLVSELKRNQRSNSNKVSRLSTRSNNLRDSKVNGNQIDGKGSFLSYSAGMNLKADSENCGNILEHESSDQGDIRKRFMQPVTDEENVEDGWQLNLKQVDDFSEPAVSKGSTEIDLAKRHDDVSSKSSRAHDDSPNEFKGNGGRGDKSDPVIKEENISRDIKTTPSGSDVGLESETTSGSTSDSDSEDERQRTEERRRRKEKILAEKVAAKAVEAIRERENMIARLEGEKLTLEKIIEGRAKQQAEEVIHMFL